MDLAFLFKTILASGCYDSRGVLRELNSADKQITFQSTFPHVLYVKSKPTVFRGLHFQFPCQAKLLYILKGVATFYALDLRRGSDTYGKLDVHPSTSVTFGYYLPAGCAFGYQAHTDMELLYFSSKPRSSMEYSVNFFDPSWNELPLMERSDPRSHFIVSQKDIEARTFKQLEYDGVVPIPATQWQPDPTSVADLRF